MSYTARHQPSGDYLAIRLLREDLRAAALEIVLPDGSTVQVEYQPDLLPQSPMWVDASLAEGMTWPD
jgi:hypothetical protein